MKDISNLEKEWDKIEKQLVPRLVNMQRKVADFICSDVQGLAPGSGDYADSIKVGETTIENNIIETPVESDMVVVSKAGTEYNLGYLLENGTLEHAIPNAFNWGVIYGFKSEKYKRTLQPDWHPGFKEIPHYYPALNLNKALYDKKIDEVMRRFFNE